MATDFFVAQFWIPMFVITLVLIAGFFYIKKRGIEKEFTSITGKRVFLGVVGSVLAIIIYSGISALQLGFNKVELGHISYNELANNYLGYWIYLFVLLGPFMLGGLVIVGIPLIYILFKFRFASFFGILQVALILAVLRGVLVVFSPYNNWCGSHPWQCLLNKFFNYFVICAVLGIGFGIGARLPIWRNNIEKET